MVLVQLVVVGQQLGRVFDIRAARHVFTVVFVLSGHKAESFALLGI